ncbi:MAG: rod shape-determining protein MreD [Kiritimatiellia bacterium]|jgi:rod shape-determining protein MreD
MRWLMFLSILLALLLSIVPLSFEWRGWRPEFMALVVIYWSTYSPQHFGLLGAWIAGLLLDVITLSPMGYHSIGLIVVAYISHLAYQRIRSYALWQQAAWVFVLVGIYQLFGNWASGFMGKSVDTPIFLVAALVTAFMWPLTVVTLRTIKIYYRIP